jgi:hypothetical protein
LHIVPCHFDEANAFIEQYHRHHQPTCGYKFAVAIADEADAIRGVVMVARPIARMLDDGWTLEVTRLCTDGVKNGCSMLYAAAWRAARAMGYRKLVTYILDSESGVSLTAAGWKRIGECGGGTWNRTARPRIDKHPLQGKIRFEAALGGEGSLH